jgi:hypothetical protein
MQASDVVQTSATTYSRVKAPSRAMLNNLTAEIRDCLWQAEECAREAAELPDDSSFRHDFLELQNRWLELAGSIDFGEQLDSFTKSTPQVGGPS